METFQKIRSYLHELAGEPLIASNLSIPLSLCDRHSEKYVVSPVG